MEALDFIKDFAQRYFSALIELTNEMAPWLILGLIFAGILKAYFPEGKVQKYMGKSNTKSAVNAALIGVPMPLCSCGVIPTGVSFYKNGASKGATNSFLISTPQTGVDSIMASYSMLGWPFAILRPIIAFVTGVAGGILTNKLVKDKESSTQTAQAASCQDSCCSSAAPTSKSKWKSAVYYAFVELLQDIGKWLVVGLLAAALISVLIPDGFFLRFRDYAVLELLVILLISVPMYTCATGSIPIAAALLLKGISPGAAIVFLMAGPATNVATITVIGKAMGRKSLLVYLAAIIGGALFFGLLVNWFIPSDFLLSHIPMLHEGEHHMLPHWFEAASSLLLIGTMLFGYFYVRRPKAVETLADKHTTVIKVEGMTCSHCEASVTENLSKLKGIEEVVANRTSNTVQIKGDKINWQEVEELITNIGYKYKGKI